MDDDFDFGFNLVDSDELEEVQKARTQASEYSSLAQGQGQKVERIMNMLEPLFRNLKSSPEKPYVYWPDRVDRINAFWEKLNEVANGD